MSTPEQPQPGPCSPWITGDEVAEFCTVLGTGAGVYDDYAEIAVQELFELSGRQFSGECGPVRVRPCEPKCVCWPDPCGCCQLSRVRLSGYPIREITEVKIDGDVIEPSGYRLDGRRYLTRLADADGKRQTWPGCQRLDLDDTEDGTFSVEYTYGQDVPLLGEKAALELACQLAAAAPDADGGECDLPDGVVRVTRQGITFDREKFVELGWAGLPFVSEFLRVYNPARLRRRSAIYSPDIQPFARQVG